MTSQQRAAMPTVLSANYLHTHATVKEIHFQTEAADTRRARTAVCQLHLHLWTAAATNNM